MIAHQSPRSPVRAMFASLALLVGIASASRPQEPPLDRLASIRPPLTTQDELAKKKEHCSADPRLLRSIGRSPGEQVRVSRSEEDFAIFTVSETLDEKHDATLRMGRLGRVRLGSSADFDGRVGPTVVVPGLTETQAKERGELIEILDDDGRNTSLLILAPHGGEIESSTDLQAEWVARKIGPGRASTWRCRGYHPRGGKAAFERWHITSTDISEASYPLLGRVAHRQFAHAVSFHGMADDRILIGGSAPTRLRLEVRDAIRRAINDPSMSVDIAMPGDANAGKEPRNIVNRYAPGGGVQVEQSPKARREHWKAIADAVAEVFGSKL